jgi:hypothetical protein
MISTRVVRAATTGVSALFALAVSGCAVVTIAGAAAGLAVDATVGAVQLTGKAIGAAASAVTPGESK